MDTLSTDAIMLMFDLFSIETTPDTFIFIPWTNVVNVIFYTDELADVFNKYTNAETYVLATSTIYPQIDELMETIFAPLIIAAYNAEIELLESDVEQLIAPVNEVFYRSVLTDAYAINIPEIKELAVIIERLAEITTLDIVTLAAGLLITSATWSCF